MGCSPSVPPPTAVGPTEQVETRKHLIFTTDERLKLKEVWVIVKQNNLKKLGDDIMAKALEKNSTLMNHWQEAAFYDQSNNLTFSENESMINSDLISKQTYKQHGYKLLEKIDQLIMIMVTRVTTTNTNDSILNEYFHRIGESHSGYNIKQDHVDVLCTSFIECLKDLIYQNGNEWTIKHELTWMKVLNLITDQFLSPPARPSSSKKTIS